MGNVKRLDWWLQHVIMWCNTAHTVATIMKCNPSAWYLPYMCIQTLLKWLFHMIIIRLSDGHYYPSSKRPLSLRRLQWVRAQLCAGPLWLTSAWRPLLTGSLVHVQQQKWVCLRPPSVIHGILKHWRFSERLFKPQSWHLAQGYLWQDLYKHINSSDLSQRSKSQVSRNR